MLMSRFNISKWFKAINASVYCMINANRLEVHATTSYYHIVGNFYMSALHTKIKAPKLKSRMNLDLTTPGEYW